MVCDGSKLEGCCTTGERQPVMMTESEVFDVNSKRSNSQFPVDLLIPDEPRGVTEPYKILCFEMPVDICCAGTEPDGTSVRHYWEDKRLIEKCNTCVACLFMRGYIADLESHWKEKALHELNETDHIKKECLETLRSLIKERDLKSLDSEEFLLRFLRARKYKTENAYKLLENYISARRRDKELFSVREALEDVEQFGDGWQAVLRGRDRKGRMVLVFRPGMYRLVSEKSKAERGAVTVDQSFRMNFLSMEWGLVDPRTQISGITGIVDLKDFSLVKHALFLSPYHSMRTSSVVQNTVPIRFGGVHIVNQPRYMDAIFALFKPFLKDKIRERVIFHGSSMERLHQHICPDVLPSEFGGTAGSLVTSEWKSRLLSRRDEILANDPSEL